MIIIIMHSAQGDTVAGVSRLDCLKKDTYTIIEPYVECESLRNPDIVEDLDLLLSTKIELYDFPQLIEDRCARLKVIRDNK